MKRDKYIILRGKAKWVQVERPDLKSGKYSLVLYPDDESLTIIKDLKENPPAILNHLKKDEDGYNMRFSCDPQKLIAGKMQLFRVSVVDAKNVPITGVQVGNGSDVTIKLEYYEWKRNGGGAAVRLKSVRVDNLIPFNPEADQFPDDLELIAGLKEQPEPLF